MRILGFFGIALLSPINAFGMLVAVRSGDWRGLALMAFMAVLLAFFARVLWIGRHTDRGGCPENRLAPGWYGETVSNFFSNQVVKSPEGLLLLAGSFVSFALAAASLTVPTVVGLPEARAGSSATLFGVWPVLAFVLYIRICGPAFRTSMFTLVAMCAVVSAPLAIAYR